MKVKSVFIPLWIGWGISIMPKSSMRMIQDKRPDLFGPNSPYSIHGFFTTGTSTGSGINAPVFEFSQKISAHDRHNQPEPPQPHEIGMYPSRP